ncbi:hypothetical protein ACFY4H_04305 [Streptomyces althioticus]|uniref:hypothetical protein n=1 Tax=Streptomyces althioticus TaxID=83380 RepID=UPI003680E626
MEWRPTMIRIHRCSAATVVVAAALATVAWAVPAQAASGAAGKVTQTAAQDSARPAPGDPSDDFVWPTPPADLADDFVWPTPPADLPDDFVWPTPPADLPDDFVWPAPPARP